MSSLIRLFVLVACSVFTYVAPGHADLIAEEQFVYDSVRTDGQTIGANANANGGTGWSAAWDTGGLDYYRSAGLDYPGTTTDGGHLENRAFTSFTSFRPLATAQGTDDTTVWLSFLIQRDDTDTQGSAGFAGLSLFDGTNERLFIGKRNNASEWGVERPGGASSNTSAIATNFNVAMLVLQVNFAPGSETVNMWALDSAAPATAAELGAAQATITANDFSFNRIRIGSGNNVYNFDEIYLGTTYESIVPEPATGLLFLTGMVAVLSRRRRYASFPRR